MATGGCPYVRTDTVQHMAQLVLSHRRGPPRLVAHAARIRVAVAAVAVTLSCVFASAAAAATFTVNTTTDPSGSSTCNGLVSCSLRQAVADASAGDMVSLPASTTPYAVTLGQPIPLTQGITISGAGARTTKIAGNRTSEIFDAGTATPLTGTLTISGVTITGGGGTQSAGALLLDSGNGATVDLNGDALSANTAISEGGAIQLLSSTLNIDDSTIGPSNVAGTTTSQGNGGAIYNGGGTLTITNSTISGNSAIDGGLGGAIFSASTTSLSSATVAFNSVTGAGATGGDIDSVGVAAATLTDTIIADGTAPGPGDADCSGTITSAGHNLVDGVASTGVAACGFTQSTDILADARLGPLLTNGGQTNTHELAAGSPAIDAGSGCPATDQRGVTRPTGACDIGALQVGGGGTQPQWSVAHDFLVPPNDANPSPDSLGNAGVWSYEQAPLATPQTPSTYSLLSNFAPSSACAGEFQWDAASNSPPIVGFSSSGTPEECPTTATLPSKTLFMTPSTGGYSVVAWKSPVQGAVDVAGSFESDDPNGGSGVSWLVDKNSTKVVSGTYGVGGGASFNASQAILPGDTLYVLVGPGTGAANDTTALNLTITQTSVVAADLALTANASPTTETGTVNTDGVPIPPPGNITDTFTVTNHGPSTAPATFTDPLPAGATLVSASPSPPETSCSGTTTVTCALGDLADGASATVTVTLQATQFGTLSNRAKVTSSTPDPNLANNSATATTQVTNPCVATTKTLDTVTVTASCIEQQSGGSFLAIGNTQFSNGASILTASTGDPAPLIIAPADHMITMAPNSDGSAAAGVLQAGGQDVADGPLTIATQGVTDPVARLSGLATIGGIQDVTVALSGWGFLNQAGGTTTAYLAPAADGGGVLIDGQLALSFVYVGQLSGAIATQVTSDGSVSVISGGVSLPSFTIPDTDWGISNPHLLYARGPDEWSGGGGLSIPDLVGLSVNPLVIKGGKLDSIGVGFTLPPPGIIIVPQIELGLTGASLSVANLNTLDYGGGPCTPVKATVPTGLSADAAAFRPPTGPVTISPPGSVQLVKSCPPPVQIGGSVSLDALDGLVTGTGSFKYVLSGSLTVTGSASLAPPLGGQLGQATFMYTPPHIFELTGSVLVPAGLTPFLKGTVGIGIDPPHFTGSAALDLIIPPDSPVLGGSDVGQVQAIISDKGGAASASLPQECLPSWLGGGCTPSESLLVGYRFASHSFQFSINGNINDYATVAGVASVARAGVSRRTVHLPGTHHLAAFTIHSLRGTPNVELISPRFHGHRLHLTLATSRRHRNHSGALASISRRGHEESFMVAIAPGGVWTVRRLKGPKIASVRVAVPRKSHAVTLRRLAPRASDLPSQPVSTNGALTLHFRIPHAPAGTTVDLWAGTQDHGAGGVLIAQGLSPSAAATWKLSGLGSGRYWPYAIVNRNGLPVAIQYWPRSVEIVDPAAPQTPTGVGATFASGSVLVGWSTVTGAASYGITATRASGGAPVIDAVPAGQLGDVLSLAAGRWLITVDAVDAEDRASVASEPISVTVP